MSLLRISYNSHFRVAFIIPVFHGAVEEILTLSFLYFPQLAYLFATTPTTEGTVKKSILRICGTCVGALSAWGLLHTTGDNVIGSVAWLTVTTALGVYLSVDIRGAAARLGSSKDFGYGGFYLVLVQTVIVMEAKVGVFGDIDELVANRLVSKILDSHDCLLVAGSTKSHGEQSPLYREATA